MSSSNPNDRNGLKNDVTPSPRSPVRRISRTKDLRKIAFTQGMAEVEIDPHDLDRLKIENDQRGWDSRLRRVIHSIFWHGYANTSPIQARLLDRGRIEIDDGGHRLTAVRFFMKSILMRWIWWRPIRHIVMHVRDTPGAAAWREKKRLKKERRRARNQASAAGPPT